MELPWDTAFFGIPIGRIDVAGMQPDEIRAAEAAARARGLHCLYATVDPMEDGATYQLQELGYRFVDAGLTFDLQVDEPAIERPEGVEFRAGTVADIPGVLGIAERMAPWSRYAVDPRFGVEAARRLQVAWLERAAAGADGDHSLVVAEADGAIIAFIGRVRSPQPRVDAVGTTRQGSGAARYLIETARSWAGDQPLLGGPIAARNVPALRYVSHCFYRVAKVDYQYHRWLDEG